MQSIIKRSSVLIILLMLFSACSHQKEIAQEATAQQKRGTTQEVEIPEISYEKFVLDNGLTLVVHQDTKAPIVAVNVWYHVGSKNEPDGRSGFAHLFEHLMFNGTENYNDEYFKPLERVGATDLNGTTNFDRTNYFQNVPKNAIDMALWLESDRMGHLLGAITQEKLDSQRGVVQNEKRQGENQPYGQVYNRIIDSVFPEGHPYDHTVIGSMEDLNAATLDDVKDWFKRYYGPNNATVVVAGDITPEEAKKKVEHYFGDIPPSEPINKYENWIAKREGTQREVMQDRVPQARLHLVWNVPSTTSPEMNDLDLISDVLASGKNSRLYKRLVYEDQIATDVSAYVWPMEISGLFVIQATAKPGEDLSEVESIAREELQKLLKEGPTIEEVQRVKTKHQASFVRGIERIGGFGGKSDILAQSEVYYGSPDAYKKELERVSQVTPEQLQQTAQKWLSDGDYVLEVHPYPQMSAAEKGADRSELPDTGEFPTADFPDLQRTTLSNGLNVILAQRSSVPLVQFEMLVDAGYAADQYATPGTASLTMNALDEGTASRTALEISSELDNIGANLNTYSNLDLSYVSLSTLKGSMDESLDLFADVILNPSFPESEVQRLKKEQIAGIQREKQTPVQMALRVFPNLLYGDDHAYGNPLTGSGTESTVSALSRDDLSSFHDTWFRPNNATLVVAGDVSIDELKPKLERLFADWSKADVPSKNIASVNHPEQSRVFLMDRPGSQQSIIFAGHVAPPKSVPNDLAIDAMNSIFGGTFTSRINMNLREEKGWAYGARSLLLDAEGQRPFIVYAPVQTDKTAQSMQEIISELTGYTGKDPANQEELEKIKNSKTLTLPGRFETIDAVSNAVGDIVRFGLPDDYYDTYADAVRALSLDNVKNASQEVLKTNRLTWVVVGDREKIESAIKELGLGEIQIIDANGNIVKKGETTR